jgi:hypothetical protein
MSRISNAILTTILEEYTNYEEVNLTESEFERLDTICDQWEDRASIESDINVFLKSIGYSFNDDTCRWLKGSKHSETLTELKKMLDKIPRTNLDVDVLLCLTEMDNIISDSTEVLDLKNKIEKLENQPLWERT